MSGNWQWYVYGSQRIAVFAPATDQQASLTAAPAFTLSAANYNSSGPVYTTYNNPGQTLVFYVYDWLGNNRISYRPQTNSVTPAIYDVRSAHDYFAFGNVSSGVKLFIEL